IGHLAAVKAVAVHPGGAAVASASADVTVRVWPFNGDALFGKPPPAVTDSDVAESAPAPATNGTEPAALGATPPPPETKPVSDPGWTLLSSGNSLDAWQGWRGASWSGAWELSNGELRSLRGGTMALMTREEFG